MTGVLDHLERLIEAFLGAIGEIGRKMKKESNNPDYKFAAGKAEEARAAGQPVRKDDDPEVFKTRLEAYNRDTAIVAPYYDKRGQLTPIDGMLPIEQVASAIDQALAG